MLKHHSLYCPVIKPVPEGEHQPLFSVMIPTYNCAEYLKLTLQSVLDQDPGPEQMQIEVIDDCSTKDDPEAIVKKMAGDRVTYFKQPYNVGAPENFNTCVLRSRGKLVHVLHGDDYILPGFYDRLGKALLDHPSVGAAYTRPIVVDENNDYQTMFQKTQDETGIMPDPLAWLGIVNCIPPPSIIIKREVYEAIGGFDNRLFHAADWELWVRIAAHYDIWYEVEPLVNYRVHSASDTSRLFQTGRNMEDRRRAVRIFSKHLPKDRVRALTQVANSRSAVAAIDTCTRFIEQGEWKAGLVQFMEGIRTSQRPAVFKQIVKKSPTVALKLLTFWK